MLKNSEKQTQVYVEKRKVFIYPSKETGFSPSQPYPEYPWGKEKLSSKKNPVYDMIRECFRGMGMDAKHDGSKDWNPLGEFIRKGDTVVVKPNLVLHQNGIKENGIDCLVTHPSVVRAVLDYVFLALGDSGTVILGDAPLQSCDLDRLVQTSGYEQLLQFYQNQGKKILWRDFRLMTSERAGNQLRNVVQRSKDFNEYTAVNLGKSSLHSPKDEKSGRLRVTNYDPKKMKEHHHHGTHEYLIPNLILEADVIINLPKPKTHRKAGMTGALKNLIGINGHKDWLPHHKKGSQKEGGDEYLYPNQFKSLSVDLQERIDVCGIKGQYRKARLLEIPRKGCSFLGRLCSKDPYREGSWYGNDTIWRTIADLNRILLYSNRKGIMCDSIQRKYLVLGDLIISGEKEGPLEPTPKQVGVIAAGTDPVAFDAAIATLMGFNLFQIPSIANAFQISTYPLTDSHPENIVIQSNEKLWNRRKLNTFSVEEILHFCPTKGWKGQIEMRKKPWM